MLKWRRFTDHWHEKRMTSRTPELTPSEPSLRARGCRLALWILLLLFTITILLFPTQLRYEYHPVESIYIFGDRLLLFGILYSIWMAALLILLFLFKSKGDEWEKLALVSVFSMVYVSFWVLITPSGRYADEVDNLAHVKYLQDAANLPLAHPTLGYFSFPGIHLTGLSLVEVSGLGIFEVRTVFLVFISLLQSMLLYVLCLKSLKSPRLASLAVLIMLQGNMLLSRQPTFWPGTSAFILFFTLLILLNRQAEVPFRAVANKLLMIVAFAALTITYLPTPVCFIFILLGIFLVQMMGKKNLFTSPIIALFAVMVLTWQDIWAVRMFESLVGWGSKFVNDLTLGGLGERLLFLRETQTHLGERAPLWASLTRSFWLLVTYATGGVLAAVNLTRVRRLGWTEMIETGGLVGVIIFCIIVQLLAPGGSQYYRVLMYSHIFTVPIALRFLSRLGAQNKGVTQLRYSHPFSKWFQPSRWRRLGLALGLILLLVLAFPTFLAHHDQVSTYNVYRYEYANGEFLRSTYGKGEGLTVFASGLTISALKHSMSEASYQGGRFEVITNEDVLWRLENEMVTDFFEMSSPKRVFVFTEKHTFSGWRLFGIEPTHPKWLELQQRLQNANRIYDNWHGKMYLP